MIELHTPDGSADREDYLAMYLDSRCPTCRMIHDVSEDKSEERKALLSGAAFTYGQDALKEAHWRIGDVIMDRDGDLWIHGDGGWAALVTRCQRAEEMHYRNLPDYSPYLVWHLEPRIPAPPNFSSPEEAQAWLDQHTGA